MAIITGGSLSSEAQVVNGGLKIVEYDEDGNIKNPVPDGAYMLPIGVRLSAAVAAGSKIWAMRNGASKRMLISRILLRSGFDGTAATSSALYEFMRFADATPSGGTAISPVKKDTTYAASTLADARYNGAAALTVTSVTFEDAFLQHYSARQLNHVSALNLEFDDMSRMIVLNPNEGLAIELNVVAVVGDTISGAIYWLELP
jgi:hypothetical protein